MSLSPSHSHTQPFVSRHTCVCTCVSYEASTMCAADLKPASRSPLSSASPSLMLPPSKTAGAPACSARALGGDVGQHLVLHLDEAQRVAGLLLGGRRDRRDLVALVHRLLAGLEHGERRLHAGRLLRGREIDRHDARVRVRRAQDARVQHPGPVDVVGVLGASRHLVADRRPASGACRARRTRRASATGTSRAVAGAPAPALPGPGQPRATPFFGSSTASSTRV